MLWVNWCWPHYRAKGSDRNLAKRSVCDRTALSVDTEIQYIPRNMHTVFFVLCFVVVMQSFLMNSYEVFIRIHQGCFGGTGAIVRLPQCQWSKPDGYGKISQCITTTKHSKAKTVCIFLGIYCNHQGSGRVAIRRPTQHGTVKWEQALKLSRVKSITNEQGNYISSGK